MVNDKTTPPYAIAQGGVYKGAEAKDQMAR